MVADFVKTMDDNATIADLFSYYHLLYGDWNSLFQQYQSLLEANSSDIKSVVKEYLKRDRVVIGVQVDSRGKSE
jgi:predicted Zn-dependent peptidase